MATVIAPPPRLPRWTARTPGAELTRPPAEKINAAENRRQTLTFAGFNQPIPIVYGEQIVSGPLIAGPVVSGGYVLYAVALCWAGARGIEQILDARVGDVVTALQPITTPASGRQTGDWWVYDGRQTAINPWLSAAIPGFTDTFPGVAYVAARFATSTTSWPQPSFRIRGRRCRDPRTGAAAWTENPVLHMLDFVENTEFGMGVQMRGAAAAAAVADSLYSGLPRTRSGLCIQDAATEDDILPLLAGYAEVLWGYDGADIVVVPDAPVSTVHAVPAEHIRSESIQLSTVGLTQIPTLVQITFTDRNAPEGWVSRPARAEAPAHTLHGGYTSASTVALPGLYNRVEAERRAWQRLQRLQVPGRVNWQMTAPGMIYEAGDVVRLPDVRGLRSVDVRLTTQPEMIAPSLWQMGGEIYSADQYPTDGGGTVVPVGAILILRGDAPVPSGWEAYSAGNGRLLREGAPGNAGTRFTLSRSWSSGLAGAHLGTRTVAPFFNTYQAGNHPDLGPPYVYYSLTNRGEVPPHRHTLSLSVPVDSVVPRRSLRLIKKTGSAGLLSPGVAFLSDRAISAGSISESRGLAGGYLSAGSVESISESLPGVGLDVSQQPAHSHDFAYGMTRDTPGLPPQTAVMGTAAGAHSHSAGVSIDAELRSIALAVYESMADPLVPEGAIVGWDQLIAPPAGWRLCNGQNGTIDLRDRFIRIVAARGAGSEFSGISEARVQIGGMTSSGAHNHVISLTRRTQLQTATHYSPYHDSQEPPHTHSISVDERVDISDVIRYQIRFIQYTGS